MYRRTNYLECSVDRVCKHVNKWNAPISLLCPMTVLQFWEKIWTVYSRYIVYVPFHLLPWLNHQIIVSCLHAPSCGIARNLTSPLTESGSPYYAGVTIKYCQNEFAMEVFSLHTQNVRYPVIFWESFTHVFMHLGAIQINTLIHECQWHVTVME